MKKVTVSINIQADAPEIIAAFTDHHKLKEWWGVDRSVIEKKNGGVYTLSWNITDKGLGYVSTGKIKTYDPNEILVIDNLVYLTPDLPFLGPMTLEIKVKARDHISSLHLCQSGYQYGPDWDWYFKAVQEAWPKMIVVLKNYLEQKA